MVRITQHGLEVGRNCREAGSEGDQLGGVCLRERGGGQSEGSGLRMERDQISKAALLPGPLCPWNERGHGGWVLVAELGRVGR